MSTDVTLMLVLFVVHLRKKIHTVKCLLKIRTTHREPFYFSCSPVVLKSTFPCCFLWSLPLGFTYSHLSIGIATATVWRPQTEWGGEWGWGGCRLLHVCVSFPVCWSAEEEVGFRWQATTPLTLVVTNTCPMHSLNQTSPLLGLVFCVDFSPIYCINAVFG